MDKESALENYANCPIWRCFGHHYWMNDGREYFVFDVCDVKDAVFKAVGSVLDRVNANEIAFYTEAIGVPVETVRAIQNICGQFANPVLYRLLGANFNKFAERVISKYGRGFFLAEYDDEEIELEKGKYYAYRIC